MQGNIRMTEKDFVWITIISVTNAIDSLNESVVHSNYSHSRKQFKDFRSRFRVMLHKQYPKEKYREPGIFALQAYDAVRAVALGVKGESDWQRFPNLPNDAHTGWVVATNANTLRVGVPMGNSHAEFVNVRFHPGAEPNITGFSIDFIPFQGTYDSLNFDAVVGDTAIVANHSRYAEFSQPYAAPGVQLLVPVKLRRPERAWLFKKPFTSPLWAARGSIVLYNGFVVWLIERKNNEHLRKGSILNQAGTMVSFAFTTLFSLQGEKLHSNLSRMTTVVWLFAALVNNCFYIEMLRRIGAKVGCDGNSFVVKYLEVLESQPHNVKKIFSEIDYPEALLRGDTAAAFHEVPYVFLAKYCNGFITGQIFKVFPRNSPYFPDISQAVLEISEKGKLLQPENSMKSTYTCSVLGMMRKLPVWD
ncbi:glutamate receptor [Citrus sinensis]|nr:glutamate receptor [Citrus sinensis]